MKTLKMKLKRWLVVALAAAMIGTSFYTADISVRAEKMTEAPVPKMPCQHGEGSCVDWFGTSMTAVFDDVYQAALEKAYNEAITYSGMTDLQKARALHDYLAQHVEYDYSLENYDGDDALLEGTAVCQGYAIAYGHLLDMAGIENTYALSNVMNHIWNFVKIDGNWYHVDVTWDDPGVNTNPGIKHDMTGKVYYDNFLVSDAGIKATGHEEWYSVEGVDAIKCTSEKYASAWWRDDVSAIFCIDGKEYYLSQPLGQMDIKLMCRTGNSAQTLYTKSSRWYLWDEPGYWGLNFSGLSYYDGKLYFNDSAKVYEITPGGKTAATVYTYTGGKGNIYGSLVCDGKIRMSIWKSPMDGTAPMVVNLPGTVLQDGTLSNVGYETSYIYSASAIPTPKLEDFSTNAGLMMFIWYQDGKEIEGPPTDPGTYTLKVKAASTATVSAVEKDFAITINKRPLTIAPKKISMMYGQWELPGASVADRFDVSGLLSAHKINQVAYSIDPLTAGNSTVTISDVTLIHKDSWEDVTEKYDITYLPETITIEKRPITLTAAPQTIMYGSKIDYAKVSVTSGILADGDEIEVGLEASSTTPTNNGVIGITSVYVKNKDGQDVTASYDITKEHGRLIIVPPHKHMLSDWYIIENPTCTKEGKKVKYCLSCNYEEGDVIPVVDHSFTVYVSNKDATCLEDGTETAKCDYCVAEDTRIEEESALGHKWSNKGVVDRAAGLISYPCIRSCGAADVKSWTPPADVVTRVYGAGRYETSLGIAEALKEKLGVDKFENIIVACGTNFPDALAGSYLSAKTDAPILMVTDAKVPLILDYIWDNLTEDGTVYLLGGTGAVPQSMEDGLKNAGIHVERLKGANRYTTNIAILNEAGVSNETILVCTGENFADSLSGSAAGLPMLLVDPKKTALTAEQKAFLETTDSDIVIIGGTGAVNAAYEQELKNYDKDGVVERLSGKGRNETSVKVAERFFDAPLQAVIAYSQNYPDGLCGGPLAYAMDSPLILTQAGKESVAAEYLTVNGITSGVALGGTGALSEKTVRLVFSMEAGKEIINNKYVVQ